MLLRPRSLQALALVAAVLFLITFVLVHASGFTIDLPWKLLVFLILGGLPFSACFFWLAADEKRCRRTYGWPLCVVLAAAALAGSSYWLLWLLLALCLRPPVGYFPRLALGAVVLICGFGVVWNLNYLLMRHMPPDRMDPWMQTIDLALYRLWFGSGVELKGLFPLTANPALLQLLDNAYAILIPEIVLVAFLLSQLPEERRITDFLRRLFGFYFAGIAIYICFPVNGPHLFYPDQQDLTRSLPATVAFASGMMHDYRAAKTGGELTGFGYFIAVPSLHVLAAIYLQHSLYSFPSLFRIFLPVNIVLGVSTVALGYHYLLDSVAAAAVYGVYLSGISLCRRWRRSTGPPGESPRTA